MILTRLIYYSENQIDPLQGSVVRALSDILSASNRNNQRLGLTGALIFDNQWFVQVLEGEREKVWHTFKRIHKDNRHSGIVVAEITEVEKRTFGNWWMGLTMRTTKTEHVFGAFVQNGTFDPRQMSTERIMALTTSLARLGLSRELAAERST